MTTPLLISRGIVTKLSLACHVTLCCPKSLSKPPCAPRRSRIWSGLVSVGPAWKVRNAMGTQARVLRHCQKSLKLQCSAYCVQSALLLLCSGPGWDPEGTRLGPGSTGSGNRCNHFGTVPRTVLCPIVAVPRPDERCERAGFTLTACQVPMGRLLTSVWHSCGPGSRPGPARVPPGSRPGPARVPTGSRPGPYRVLRYRVCCAVSIHW